MAGTPYELTRQFRVPKTSYNDYTIFQKYMSSVISQNQRRIFDYLTATGDSGFYLVVNDEELIKQMDGFMGERTLYGRTIRAAIQYFTPIIIPTLLGIVQSAADSQSDGAFPIKFRQPLYNAIRGLPVPHPTGNAPHLVTVDLPNLYDILGGADEYEAAFHHGALLPQRTFLISRGASRAESFRDIRANIRKKTYHWEELATQDPRKRYQYWKALYSGKSSFTVRPGTGEYTVNAQSRKFSEIRGEPVEIPIVGSWEETVDARLVAWQRAKPGGAPQWLLLEYGQPKYDPKIQINESGFITSVKTSRKSITFQYESGLDLVAGASPKAVINEVRGQSNYKTPANITAAWVTALSQEWTTIVAGVWAEQINAFNKIKTRGAYFDKSVGRLRNPINGRFMKFPKNIAKNSPIFRGKGFSIESLEENLRGEGVLGAKEYLRHNYPLDYRDIVEGLEP